MKGVFYAVILTALFFVPLKRVDVRELEPVLGLAIYRDDSELVLETDGGAVGRGKSTEEAFLDLKESIDKNIYLDTVRYLFVGEGVQDHEINALPEVKRNVRVLLWDAKGYVGECVQYVSVHGKMPMIRDNIARKNKTKKTEKN